jgi:hypothetical protein
MQLEATFRPQTSLEVSVLSKTRRIQPLSSNRESQPQGYLSTVQPSSLSGFA